MKLSLAWIFDHLNADWRKQDVDHIYAQFNRITAEMEGVERVSHDLSGFFFGIITDMSQQEVTFSIPECAVSVKLAVQSGMLCGHVFLLKKTATGFVRATHADFNGEKEGALPAFDCTEAQLKGGWRDVWQKDDVIIEVDNKSITHRPDMWSHRGFAREIGAFLGIALKPVSDFLADIKITKTPQISQKTAATPIAIAVEVPQACSRFTGLYFQKIVNKPCNILLASRLLNVGARPMDGVVDVANYLMLDWGQPVHTYDAGSIAGGKIVVRMAKEGEILALLGGADITMNSSDTVIADDSAALCLAGVKGGTHSGVTPSTAQLFFEAATFDAGTIRKSAQRHKMRTDASARFEKTLDPEQTWQACQRFVSLLVQAGIEHAHANEIIQIGKEVEPAIITVSHAFLEERIGMALETSVVTKILVDLEFSVELQDNIYTITIPSFRATKDVKLKEDILEEVVRSYGFDNIKLILPMMTRTPFSLQAIQRRSKIKHYFARAVHMMEQQNYALADQQFCDAIGYKVAPGASLMNPLSEHFAHMVTSLIPNLLKNIIENNVHQDVLQFFESARIWPKVNSEGQEQASVAGVYFKKRSTVDFYACKQEVAQLFAELGLDMHKLAWSKANQSLAVWYHPHQTASITYNGKVVGLLGKMNPSFAPALGIDTEFDLVLFELDGDFLEQEKPHVPACATLSKFQDTFIDLSLMVPLALPAAQLVASMQSAHVLIKTIEQLDCFENPAWRDVRSLTYRLWLSAADRTLEKQDIDVVWHTVTEKIKELGAQIRV